MNLQHLEDEREAAEHPVRLRRQLDGQGVNSRADQQTVDEVGLAVAPCRPALPFGVGRVVVTLQLHQDLAGVDSGGRRGGDGDGRGGWRQLGGAGGAGQREEGGGGRSRGFWPQQAERQRRLAVVLLLAAVPDLLQAGRVVSAAGGTNITGRREGREGVMVAMDTRAAGAQRLLGRS